MSDSNDFSAPPALANAMGQPIKAPLRQIPPDISSVSDYARHAIAHIEAKS